MAYGGFFEPRIIENGQCVKTITHGDTLFFPQVALSNSLKLPQLGCSDIGFGNNPATSAPYTAFYLDKHQSLPVFRHDIDFPQTFTKSIAVIRLSDTKALFLQITTAELLAERTEFR